MGMWKQNSLEACRPVKLVYTALKKRSYLKHYGKWWLTPEVVLWYLHICHGIHKPALIWGHTYIHHIIITHITIYKKTSKYQCVDSKKWKLIYIYTSVQVFMLICISIYWIFVLVYDSTYTLTIIMHDFPTFWLSCYWWTCSLIFPSY